MSCRIEFLRCRDAAQSAGEMWVAFVSIVLALSGVEAIANLTGVMKKPVPQTASKAIWVVAGEVAIFNVVLAVCMLAIFPLQSRRACGRHAGVPDGPLRRSMGRMGGANHRRIAAAVARPTPRSPT